MINPKDAEPVMAVWLEQLDRRNIDPRLYETLLNRAVDRRTKCLQEGAQPPALTVELFLAEFELYRKEVKQQYTSLLNFRMQKQDLYYAKQTLERNDEAELVRVLSRANHYGEKFQSVTEYIETTERQITETEAKAEKLWASAFLQEDKPKAWY